MTTSPTISLCKPTGNAPISKATLTYIKARAKHEIYNILVREFKKSGVSQADLARRLGKEPTALSRHFAGPGNVTVETVAEILFASNGTFLQATAVQHPAYQRLRATIEVSPITENSQSVKTIGTRPAESSTISKIEMGYA